MKKDLLLTLMCMLFAFAGFTACSDDDEQGSLPAPSFAAVSGKYNILDSSSPYQSIELGASGNYIVTLQGAPSYQALLPGQGSGRLLRAARKDQAQTKAESYGYFIYGTYTDQGNGHFVLEGFGSVTITTDENGNVTSLSVTNQSGQTQSFTAEKEQAQPENSMTTSLCRTWRVDKIHEVCQDKEYPEDSYDITVTPDNYQQYGEPGDFATEVLFSQYGTYFLIYDDGSMEMAEWRWKDQAAGTFFYAWDGEWYEEDYATVSFSGNTAIIRESWDDEYERVEQTIYLTAIDHQNANQPDEPSEEPQPEPSVESPVEKVFTGRLPYIVDNDDVLVYENGFLTKIVDKDDLNNITCQFRYNYVTGAEGPDVEVLNEAGEVEMQVWLNEQGFAERVIEVEYDDETTITYDADGHPTIIDNGREERHNVLTWENGDLVNMTWNHYGETELHEWDFEYHAEENTDCVMAFYDIYNIDIDQIENLYWAGLLGKAPLHKVAKEISAEDGGVTTYTWGENGISILSSHGNESFLGMTFYE